mmetsp:Transcript_29981/g.57584  ORF Transcript_29981/g.57584 Transcript_29981/m.57584 type:complete len:109 (+) Transcript_29981:428-754(+)
MIVGNRSQSTKATLLFLKLKRKVESFQSFILFTQIQYFDLCLFQCSLQTLQQRLRCVALGHELAHEFSVDPVRHIFLPQISTSQIELPDDQPDPCSNIDKVARSSNTE